MRRSLLLLLVLATACLVAGCSDGVAEKDKAKTADKFKQLDKNDTDHIATR